MMINKVFLYRNFTCDDTMRNFFHLNDHHSELCLTIALTYNVKHESVTSLTSLDNTVLLESGEGASLSEIISERKTLPVDHYAEWDDMETINAVANALRSGGHDVELIEANHDAFEKLRATNADIVFNIAEGINGAAREGQIPTFCEMLGLRYVASDPITLAITLDKSRTKEILGYHNIPSPRFIVAKPGDNVKNSSLRFPLMVKPLHEGSSKGIRNSSLVETEDELHSELNRIWTEYEQSAIVEEFLSGREFTVSVLGNGNEAKTLPIVEINFDALPAEANKVYSYEAKWIWDRPENPLDMFTCPAHIDKKLEEAIRRVTLDAYRVLGCRDWSRIDVRCDASGTPYIIEVNPLPGILPRPEDNSCLPKAARAAGFDYSTLILRVLAIACERYGIA